MNLTDFDGLTAFFTKKYTGWGKKSLTDRVTLINKHIAKIEHRLDKLNAKTPFTKRANSLSKRRLLLQQTIMLADFVAYQYTLVIGKVV